LVVAYWARILGRVVERVENTEDKRLVVVEASEVEVPDREIDPAQTVGLDPVAMEVFGLAVLIAVDTDSAY
jgi:Tfp pilus assembly PilM family ATPase